MLYLHKDLTNSRRDRPANSLKKRRLTFIK